MKCLGLIGGLGVGATVHYYRELTKTQLQMHIVHADMHRVFRHVQASEPGQLAEYLAELISQLKAGGAGIAAISAVMPHLCVNELSAISPLPLVNLLDSVREEVETRNFRRLALFGTRYTVQSRLFGQLTGVDVITPTPDEVEYIHNTYFELASNGKAAEEQRTGLTQVAHTLIERDGLDAIVLAGTDLSLLFDESNTDFPHVDCSRLHIDSIKRSLLT